MPFPSLELLDSFKRGNENPLSNGGQWSIIHGFSSGGRGAVVNEQFESKAEFGLGTAASFWNVKTFTSPAVADIVSKEPTELKRTFVLFAALVNPTEESRSGYVLTVEREILPGMFAFILAKMVEGVFSTLAETTGVSVAQGDLLGLQVTEGKVIAWHKSEVGSWTIVNEHADASYTAGYVGIGARGEEEAGVQNFEAVSGEAEPAPEVEKPSNQTSKVGESVSLSIVATHTTEYKAENLPKGLTINSGTGKITGKPTTVEETEVTVTVKGSGGEASTKFKWTITASGKKNRTFMVL